jgi:hypothetical protein
MHVLADMNIANLAFIYNSLLSVKWFTVFRKLQAQRLRFVFDVMFWQKTLPHRLYPYTGL